LSFNAQETRFHHSKFTTGYEPILGSHLTRRAANSKAAEKSIADIAKYKGKNKSAYAKTGKTRRKKTTRTTSSARLLPLRSS
jgi:hypothetical protein